MSLYKVYESAKFAYRLQPVGGYKGYSYDDDILAGDYLDSLFGAGASIYAIWGQRKGISETPTAHTTVYALFATKSCAHPSWKIGMEAFDGQTGALKWADYDTYGFNVVMLIRDNYWQDTDDNAWSHHTWGHTYRHPLRTESINNFAGQAGMPDYSLYDLKIYDTEWLDEYGVPLGTGYVKAFLGATSKENRAMYVKTGDDFNVRIANLTTKEFLFKIPVTRNAKKAIIVDNEIMYVFTTDGLINVLNYKTGVNSGILSLGEGFAGQWSFLSIGYDPTYRRMLVFRPEPDDPVTGASNCFIEGYRFQEVPVHLQKPIPLQAPREGRVVPVYSRVVSSTAGGIAGMRVSATITGSNGLAPSSQVTDALGGVRFNWDTSIAGTDIDQIDLQVSFEDATPGLQAPPSNPTLGNPPGNVENITYFKPGWWIYQTMSDATPASKWDSLLASYTTNDEIPFSGVLQEYKWTDFEKTTPGSFDWSKPIADAAYLAGKGMYLIISIQLNSESDSDVWIPDDIRDDISLWPNDIYPQSNDPYSFVIGRGIYHLENTNASGQGFAPIIWVESVHARLRALLTGMNVQFAADTTVIGYAVGDARNHYTDINATALNDSNTSSPRETFYEARLRALAHLDSITSKMVWEFPSSNAWGHAMNCMRDGYNIAPSRFYMDGESSHQVFYAMQMSTADTVSTGIIADAGAFSRDENKLCTSGTPQATAYQMAFGGADVIGCSMNYMEDYGPYFVFWYPDSGQWSATDGIQEVVETYTLGRVRAYLGT